MNMRWPRHSCPRSSSSRPIISRHSSFSKFLPSSLPSVNLAKDIEAGVADTPHLRPRRLRHLPHAQLAQDRDPGGIGGGGPILPRERRVPVHLLPQDDDVLTLARTVPRGGMVPVTIVPQGAPARGLLRGDPPFQGKASPSFRFVVTTRLRQRLLRRRCSHTRLDRFSFSLRRPVFLVWFNLDSANLDSANLDSFNPGSSSREMS